MTNSKACGKVVQIKKKGLPQRIKCRNSALHEGLHVVHKGTVSWTSTGCFSQYDLLHLGLRDHVMEPFTIPVHGNLICMNVNIIRGSKF